MSVGNLFLRLALVAEAAFYQPNSLQRIAHGIPASFSQSKADWGASISSVLGTPWSQRGIAFKVDNGRY